MLKIKIFLWQMFQNRLPTADNVAKRNGPSDWFCVVCGTIEAANHAFFRCHLARFSCSTVRAALQQNWNPSSGADLLQIIHTQKGASARIVW
uniref:Reverse transcriptase zinc-binding domain-containing protein n=1 Tax=Aegilops tauschii subsp. strangulata TaxID=200361 RepID=A0A453KQ98_AEGTS